MGGELRAVWLSAPWVNPDPGEAEVVGTSGSTQAGPTTSVLPPTLDWVPTG